MKPYDVIIIGGGLAGLVSALHLSKKKLSVAVIEKNAYPKHKVCGEYISNEVLPYLKSLDFDPIALKAKEISNFIISSSKSNALETQLPLGGFGMSRYALDYELAKKAMANGVSIFEEMVVDVQYENDGFYVQTKKNTYQSTIVLGAYGKRSNIDMKLKRAFTKKASPYLAVKAHYKGEFSPDLVGLHNFKGGYCGVSKVENDHINICYITSFKAFKAYKNIDDFQQHVLYENKHLKTVLENSTLVFEKPITISQISFAVKTPVEQHILMMGDTAGMIHPLCGNGMAMGIRSAQIASELVVQFFSNEISSRALLEQRYQKEWNREFKNRLRTGRQLASLFRMYRFSEIMLFTLKLFPKLLPFIIKKTHGKHMRAMQ